MPCAKKGVLPILGVFHSMLRGVGVGRVLVREEAQPALRFRMSV